MDDPIIWLFQRKVQWLGGCLLIQINYIYAFARIFLFKTQLPFNLLIKDLINIFGFIILTLVFFKLIIAILPTLIIDSFRLDFPS